MKICYIGSVFPRHHKDSEVPWLRTTLRLLRERGYDITAYVPSFRGLRSHTIDGIPVKRFRYFFAPWETLTHDEGAPNKIHKFHYKIITIFYILFGTLGLIRLHLKERFDILHIHWPFPHGFFGVGALFFRRSKVILNFHGASLLLMQKYGFVKFFLSWFIKKADAVIVNSSFTKGRVTSLVERQVHVVPYGTTITPHATDRSAVEPHHILSVGRLIERKGLPYLIRAMPEIVAKWPDARCTIAGGGPLQQELISLAETEKVSSAVNVPGKVSQEELESLFARCGVFVLPSIVDSRGDTEGLGVVLIEALTYRKPIVATNVGGIPDIVNNGVTGLLVPQKAPSTLAQAISSIFADPVKAAFMADAGFDSINRKFSWTGIIDQLSDIYCRAAASKE
ncbi:MAG: glycosyltransferase [Chitinivibrionales bacterium]|nr:glycosyltransferase [Chitinivibrionales bacterium]